ncbi:hypothetical protein QWY90_07275 [Flavobacterium paronense]|uniref:DUF3822 family protein n=2 Tax=Flavobacterium paronense TaxID=1392775 RepID=A0ABV5GGG5_9FLAO|nr:hypothetical protein [Flavobacterium paronense]MDN3677111.1 hypothetical protein [Flavobacterium paronense]
MTQNNKLHKQLELTHEQTSPLFRIMSIQNKDEPHRRHFENNICAFHIGNGFILSVAHNLKTEATLFKSIDNTIYLTDIFPFLNAEQAHMFESCYPLEMSNQRRYATITNPTDFQTIINLLKQINFDTRWVTLMERSICKTHLVIQFKNNLFYNSPELTSHFNHTSYFEESTIHRHTFLVEVALVEAFYNEDIALYKIINTPQAVIDAMPSLEIDYSILDDNQEDYYCLQSSPTSEIGKLLNKAQIEGFTEHFAIFQERIGGNYNLEGLRYLIKGYFRFGSSGAPYVVYNAKTNTFKVNAVQSEACPIQLSINNQRDGNFQYVNAIATPLQVIQERLEKHINTV